MSSAGISAAAVAQSTAATIAANKAQDAACAALLSNYRADQAQVREMQQYASCVTRLYPQHTGADVLWLKAIIIATILATVAGVIFGWRTHDIYASRWSNALLGGFLGAILGGGIVCAAWAAVLGIRYVLT